MRNYKDIPSWWFYLLLIVTITISFLLCILLKDEVQIPWWALLFACAMAFIFTLPISIITATTNQVRRARALAQVLKYLLLIGNAKDDKNDSDTNLL